VFILNGRVFLRKLATAYTTDIRVRFDKENHSLYTAADYVSLCLKTAQGYKEAWEAERRNSGASFLLCAEKSEEGALW